MLGVAATWKSKAVIAAGRGLAKAGGRSQTPRPAIAKDQLIQLGTTTGRRNDLTVVALIRWAFLPRGPSERLLLRRRRAGEDLSSDGRLDKKVGFGMSGGRLIIKVDERKHIAGGSKPVRMYTSEDYAPEALKPHIPQLFCPAC